MKETEQPNGLFIVSLCTLAFAAILLLIRFEGIDTGGLFLAFLFLGWIGIVADQHILWLAKRVSDLEKTVSEMNKRVLELE